MRRFISAAITGFCLAACSGGPSNSAALEHGRQVYQINCQGCHMEDGGGVPNLNAPLIGSKYVAGDDTKLISIVLQGSQAFANDPSRTYRNMMGSMSNLNDREIADVLTYIRNNFKNKAPDITAEEVKSVREKLN